jgi:CBS-domain-containing membrane protein
MDPEVGGGETPTKEEAVSTWQRRLVHGVIAWVGAFTVIGATWKLFADQHLVFAFASLGGSAVIVFAMPDSLMAQPRSLFGGHLVASIVGLVFNALLGTDAWSIGIAMATALVVMQLTRTVHSPAGADPIIIMTVAMSPPMVMLNLAVGLALLWFVGTVLLNAAGISPYSARAYAVLERSARLLTGAVRRLRRARP